MVARDAFVIMEDLHLNKVGVGVMPKFRTKVMRT